MRSVQKLALMCVMILFVASCTMFQGIKTPDQMSPKEKATWMNNVYAAEWDAYIAKIALAVGLQPEMYALMVKADPEQAAQVARDANLTEDQRRILRTKKKVLGEVEPLIKLYSRYVDEGKIPTDALFFQIEEKLNQLEMAIISGGM